MHVQFNYGLVGDLWFIQVSTKFTVIGVLKRSRCVSTARFLKYISE